MARAKLTGFDELERFLGKLAQPEKMAIKAVDAAAPILEESFKAEVRSAANRKDKYEKPYSKGDLAEHIVATKAKENHLGVYAVVRPIGSVKRGEKELRNAEKLAYLEYGVASHGQKPHPVRQKAINSAEAQCEKTMQDVIYKEVDKL